MLPPLQSNHTLERYSQALEERAKQDNLRALRSCRPLSDGKIEINGRELVNFASNDYLGLSRHPALIERSQEYAQKYGTGNGASRLLSGNLNVFEEIENKLASLKGQESALLLPTGFQCNSSVIPALLSKTSVALADRLVHKSIIEGLLLSGSNWTRYAHSNLSDLNEKLKRHENHAESRWTFTESVFSMDGDCSRLEELIPISESRGFALYIDEAHATGVLGKNGMGLSSGIGFNGISMGTFGKGLGSFGAYLCLPRVLRDYLINFCSGLIYSTALPPPVLGAIDAALDLIPQEQNKRDALQERANKLRRELKDLGFDTGPSESQILPIIVGSAKASLELAAHLEECGFFIPAIRPPTVPEGTARLRLSITSSHTDTQIEKFLQTLRKWHERKY